MAKSRGRKFAELVAPANGVFAAASIPTIAISKLAASTFSVNSESASLGGNVVLDSNDVTEHSSALYFTNTRADTRSDARIAAHNLLARAGGTMTGNLTLGDNVNAYFGANTDLRIYHDGTNSHIINSTGELRFTGSNFAIKSDSAKLYFGTSDDLQIYHDGSNSYINDTGTGALFLKTGYLAVAGANGNQLINAEQGAAVELYHNNAKKLETTSGGVTVTGTLTATTLAGTLSTAAQTNITSVGTLTSTLNTSTGASTRSASFVGNGIEVKHPTGASDLFIGSQTGNDVKLSVAGANALRLYTNSTERLNIAGTGAITFNNAFTFPTSDGSANQILQTNGSGTLSWVTNSGGSSQWTASGSNAYYSSGNVGIGSSTVSHPLTVQDGANMTMLINRTANNEPANLNEFSSYYSLGIVNRNSGTYLNFGGGSGGTKIQATDGAGSATAKYLTLNPYGGNVGIGTGNTAPATPLHINSATDQKILLSGSADPYIRWQEGSTNKAFMQWNTVGYLELRNQEVNSYWTLGDAFKLYPTTDAGFTIERSGTYLRQQIKNTNTNGTYSYLQLTTYNSSSADDSGYIIKNAAQNAGNGLGNNSLYLWNGSNEVELVPAGTIAKRTTVDTSGNLTVRGGSTAASGIVGIGYTGYFGLRQADQTLDSEYMIVTKPSDHTYISANSGYNVIIRSSANNSTNQVVVGSGATGLSWRGNTVWTGENDGHNSGLDADLLDGLQSDIYFKSYTNNNGGWAQSNRNFSVRSGGDAVGLHMEESTGTFGFQLYGDGSNYGFLDAEWGNWDLKKITNGELYVDAGSGLQKVWHAGNDGAGSGLDADTLDTLSSGDFARLGSSYASIFGGTPSGSNKVQFFNGAGQSMNSSTGSLSRLECYQATAGADAFMTFHVGGDYAFYFGIDGATNDLSVGGWSMGANKYKVWHAGNDGASSGLDADLLDGNHASAFLDTSSTIQRKAAGIQLGSTSTLSNASATLSLAASSPYISFHHGSGARTAYFQEASSRFYFGECTYTETEGSFRAPIFYDVNNTAYYSDQANVSRLNNIRPDIISTPASGNAAMMVFGTGSGSPNHINLGGSSADPANNTNTVGISWGTRSDNNGYYLIGVHNYNNSYSTHSRLRLAWHTGVEIGGSPTYGGVRIFEDSPWVNSTEQARFMGSSGIVFSRSFTDTVDIRAPIFYDSANTSYYLDPGSSGTALKMSGSINMDATGWTGEIPGKIQYHGNQWYFQSAQGIFHFRNSSGANLVYSDASGNVYNTVSTRAPIFYDSANTGYYCDPASTSNLNLLTTNSTTIFNSTVIQQDNQQFRQEGYFRTNTSGQNTNTSADAYSFGYQVAGGWSHPYPDLILGFHTGVRIGGHKNYHGTRFYNDHPDKGASSTEIFSVGKSDDHIRATNNIYAYTSDKRLKENFRPIENAVDKVKALGGFIFDWRKDMMDKHSFAPDQEKDDAGLIAQEVQKVMPAAIRRAPFDYDPDKRNHSKSGEEFMTVQYEKMVPLLIEAIKEQQEQIDQLKKLLEEKE